MNKLNVLIIFIFLIHTLTYGQKVIYVAPESFSPSKQLGTFSNPFTSIDSALQYSRRSKVKLIKFRGGEYFNVSINLIPADSGLSLESFGNEKPVLIGGVLIDKYELVDSILSFSLPKGVSSDFRLLSVNDTLASLSRFPLKGFFTYLNRVDYKAVPAIQGFWNKKPSSGEYTILKYNKNDFNSLDIDNCEVAISHNWMESYVGISKMDTTNSTITLSIPASDPLGVKFDNGKRSYNYVIWNTKYGFKQPGQWYVDKVNRKVYYRLKRDQISKKIKIIVPSVVNIIKFNNQGVKNLKIKGIALMISRNSLLNNEDFAAKNIDAIVEGSNIKNIFFENVSVEYCGGSAMKLYGSNITIISSKFKNLYGGGIYISGSNYNIHKCEVGNVGLLFKGSVAIKGSVGSIYGDSLNKFDSNVIYNLPYSAICNIGYKGIIANNTITNYMNELNDGAGIYSGKSIGVMIKDNILRSLDSSNIGIYFDELSSDCFALNNKIYGSSLPFHCHLSSNIVIDNNYVNSSNSVNLSFLRSENISFINNRMIANSFDVKYDLNISNIFKKFSFNTFTNKSRKDSNDKFINSFKLLNIRKENYFK